MPTDVWVAGGIALAQGIVGGALTWIGPWYKNLRKPWFQPPDWAFGPAWSVILALAAWAGVVAWRAAGTEGERADVILLFAVNGVFFVLWTPLFFAVKRPDWALVEVVFLWASVLALVVGLWPISPFASLLVTPYLAWVTFASVLNRAIVRLNAPFP
jgi:tryptophan-rich sensory protein